MSHFPVVFCPCGFSFHTQRGNSATGRAPSVWPAPALLARRNPVQRTRAQLVTPLLLWGCAKTDVSGHKAGWTLLELCWGWGPLENLFSLSHLFPLEAREENTRSAASRLLRKMTWFAGIQKMRPCSRGELVHVPLHSVLSPLGALRADPNGQHCGAPGSLALSLLCHGRCPWRKCGKRGWAQVSCLPRLPALQEAVSCVVLPPPTGCPPCGPPSVCRFWKLLLVTPSA